jgi:hypothetical protein
MVEILERERLEKITYWEHTLMAVGLLLGGDPKKFLPMLNMLKDSLKEETLQHVGGLDRLEGRLRRKLDVVQEEKKNIERLEKLGRA